MLRPLTLLALAAALAPAAQAQIQKCVGPHGVSFADGNCPPGTKAVGALPPTRAGAVVTGAAAPGAVPDAPLEFIDTGIPVITQLGGKFAWLDDGTLAVTTFADPKAKVPWMVRKIVSFDVDSRATATLVPRGFIDCTNAEYNLVGLEIGDLESRFAVGSHAAPAVQQFQVWSPDARTLAPAPAEYKAAWNAKACLKPTPEDRTLEDLAGSKKPVRYLQPQHGTIEWGSMDATGHPEGPSLHSPRRKVMLSSLSINDITHDVRYLPFRNGYQLAAGVHDRAIDPPRDVPLLTMGADGRVARHAIPASLTRALDAAGATAPATMIAVKPGELVVQPGAGANGGGLYLVQGEQSRRVWCTTTPAPGQAAGADACAMSQPLAISPNGCRIAFDARAVTAAPAPFNAAPTIKVADLCPAAGRSARVVARTR